MARITVNFNKIVNRIKPMHAVGQPPFTGGFAKLDFSPLQALADANIPYSRLHDVGAHSEAVDTSISRIFSAISTQTLTPPTPTISPSPTSL